MLKPSTLTQGVHHVGLTVPDVEETKQFFIDILGYKQVGEKPEYPAVILSDGIGKLSLWQVQGQADPAPFDRKHTVGLHHLALVVQPESLELLYSKLLGVEGVSIEFPPEFLGNGPTRHMMFSIPSGIRMELIAPAPVV